jgi:Zn-finger nucleic acid-binding protein
MTLPRRSTSSTACRRRSRFAISRPPKQLPERYLYCASHGAWLPQQTMTAAFARASFAAHAGRGTGRTYGGASTAPDTGLAFGGMGIAMRAVHSAFGREAPADAGLAIRYYRAPRVHTVFVSAFKDRRLGCPVCEETELAYGGDRWLCPTCAGAFVETAALAAMVAEMTNETWELPPVAGKEGQRTCPICSKPMLVEVYEAATIDHCPEHGVWFDETELGSILFEAGTGKQPHTVGAWLKQLFHRHGKVDDR